MISKTFCPLPWLSIETSPNGSYKPCCVYTETISGIDARTGGVDRAQKTDYMIKLRERFRNGERPEQCRHCWAEEDSGKTSKREYSIIKFNEQLKEFKGTEDEVSPLFLDLKLGNTCNIRCRICGSWSSSAWAPEEKKLFNNIQAFESIKQGKWADEGTEFWWGIDSALPHVEYFELTGGEPFLIKKHFDVLKRSVELGYSKNQFLHYNTNGTIIPQDAIENIWPHFKKVEVAFSIDDLAARFEYQRHPAKWHDVLNTIEHFYKLKQQASWLTTQVCITVSMFNILNIPHILNWAIWQKRFDMIHLNYLHGPEDFCLHQLPDNFKQQVLDEYKCWPYHKERLEPVMNFMMSQSSKWPNSERLKKLKYHDQYRGEDFSKTFPKEWKLLNEVA